MDQSRDRSHSWRDIPLTHICQKLQSFKETIFLAIGIDPDVVGDGVGLEAAAEEVVVEEVEGREVAGLAEAEEEGVEGLGIRGDTGVEKAEGGAGISKAAAGAEGA